jgi:hypothetical protein
MTFCDGMRKALDIAKRQAQPLSPSPQPFPCLQFYWIVLRHQQSFLQQSV